MILITGHRGFIGRAIVGELQQNFRQARAAGQATVPALFYGFDLPEHTIICPDPWNPQASKNGAFKGLADLEDKVQCSDSVIHVAAVADLNESEKHPEMNERVNVEGTRNVARLCAKHGKRMTYISTCCAYGSAGEDGAILTEEVRPRPTELYAESKLRGEKAIRWISRVSLPWKRWNNFIICRIGTVYGPGMRPALFNSIALRTAIAGGDIDVHGDGRQTRTYGYVDDIVHGVLVAHAYGRSGEIYNVTGEGEVSVKDTVWISHSLARAGGKINYVPDRKGQIRRELVSCAKLKKLGWVPRVEYREGMRRSYEWLKGVKDGQ